MPQRVIKPEIQLCRPKRASRGKNIWESRLKSGLGSDWVDSRCLQKVVYSFLRPNLGFTGQSVCRGGHSSNCPWPRLQKACMGRPQNILSGSSYRMLSRQSTPAQCQSNLTSNHTDQKQHLGARTILEVDTGLCCLQDQPQQQVPMAQAAGDQQGATAGASGRGGQAAGSSGAGASGDQQQPGGTGDTPGAPGGDGGTGGQGPPGRGPMNGVGPSHAAGMLAFAPRPLLLYSLRYALLAQQYILKTIS